LFLFHSGIKWDISKQKRRAVLYNNCTLTYVNAHEGKSVIAHYKCRHSHKCGKKVSLIKKDNEFVVKKANSGKPIKNKE